MENANTPNDKPWESADWWNLPEKETPAPAPAPTCAECRYCRAVAGENIHTCNVPTSWGGLGIPVRIAPTAAACDSFKPKSTVKR